MNAIDECYHALAVSIVHGCCMEAAFDRLSPRVKRYGNRDTSKKIPDEDLIWILDQRKQGVSYQEIGRIYGTSPAGVHRFLQRRGYSGIDVKSALVKGGQKSESTGSNG